MIHSYRLLVCCFCLTAWNAFGLDITGVIVDSATQETLDSAKLCLDLDPNECTNSDSLGRFHFISAVGILTHPKAAVVFTPTVRYAHGNLDLYHFGTGAGWLKVFDMLGRCLYAKSFVSEKG